ncbi:MAG: LuxR C-terminal-related transcriptional regulator [Firmicutes bacterium]|nr:LuxR C-terminal-related transcriptional regulator [Bacillota bacterium]
MDQNLTMREEQVWCVSVVSSNEIGYWGLCEVVSREPDLRCCSDQEKCGTWSIEMLSPAADVVVAMLAPGPLMDVVRAGNASNPRVPVVGVIDVLPVSEEDMIRLVQAGVMGLTTSLCPDTIVSLVRFAVHHVGMIDTALVRAMMREHVDATGFHGKSEAIASLSRTERRILAWIAHGYTNRQIAAELGTTISGARHRVSRLLKQLGISSRIMSVPLYFAYYENQLVSRPDDPALPH